MTVLWLMALEILNLLNVNSPYCLVIFKRVLIMILYQGHIIYEVVKYYQADICY